MQDLSILKHKLWRRTEPGTPLDQPKGMVGPKERACYYWFARHWLKDMGYVIDAGAFLGASTFSLAAGAADSGRRELHGRPIIQAFDYFKVVDDYVGEAIRRDFREISVGESYLDIFESQTRNYNDMIEVHSGDFMLQKWFGSPIEILFIDIAKTETLNSHVIGEFFKCLIPGHSVVMHQDYFHAWHPYIHVSMEYFDEEFELLDEHVPYQTRVWRLVKAIPQEKLDIMSAYSISKEDQLALLDRLAAKSSSFSKPMIEVARIWQICLHGEWLRAQRELQSIRTRYDLESTQSLWARQALEIERHIKNALLSP